MIKNPKKIGEILIVKGLISDGQLKSALEEQGRTKEFLGKILIKNDFIKERDLLTVLSEQFAMPLISLKDRYIDWKLVEGFTASLILDYKCFPLARDDRSVTMAITNPQDVHVMAKAEEEAKGLRLKFVLVLVQDMADVIARYKQYMKGQIARIFKSS